MPQPFWPKSTAMGDGANGPFAPASRTDGVRQLDAVLQQIGEQVARLEAAQHGAERFPEGFGIPEPGDPYGPLTEAAFPAAEPGAAEARDGARVALSRETSGAAVGGNLRDLTRWH